MGTTAKGFASVVKRIEATNFSGKIPGHRREFLSIYGNLPLVPVSRAIAGRDSLYPLNVQHTIRKGDSTALCIHAEDVQVLQLIQFSRILSPPYQEHFQGDTGV